METKVLLRLIKDDIKLLDEINGSFMSGEKLSPEEVEVALTRARSLVMEFEMLGRNVVQVKDEVVQIESSVQSATQDQDPILSKEAELPENDSELIDLEEEEVSTPKVEEAILKTVVEDSEVDGNRIGEETAEIAPKPMEPVKVMVQGGLFEEAEQKDGKAVGEIFGVNPQMENAFPAADRSKITFEAPPLKSIRDGIGINDRFLFIRELFGNEAEKYEETIAALDGFNMIEEAVSYLKQHFKWNKSEAGQKFLNLVKRRFKQ